MQVRHAQGIHNVEGEKDHSAYMSPALLDAQLTPLGWSQVRFLVSFFVNKSPRISITTASILFYQIFEASVTL
jgi:broad specificity phosphatase PhoE